MNKNLQENKKAKLVLKIIGFASLIVGIFLLIKGIKMEREYFDNFFDYPFFHDTVRSRGSCFSVAVFF